MRLVKYILILLVIAAGVMFLVGYRLPEDHETTREREYAHSPDRVFQVIASPAEYPRWRTGVQRVELLPDSGREKRFKEFAIDGDVVYAIESSVPNQRFVFGHTRGIDRYLKDLDARLNSAQ